MFSILLIIYKVGLLEGEKASVRIGEEILLIRVKKWPLSLKILSWCPAEDFGSFVFRMDLGASWALRGSWLDGAVESRSTEFSHQERGLWNKSSFSEALSNTDKPVRYCSISERICSTVYESFQLQNTFKVHVVTHINQVSSKSCCGWDARKVFQQKSVLQLILRGLWLKNIVVWKSHDYHMSNLFWVTPLILSASLAKPVQKRNKVLNF